MYNYNQPQQMPRQGYQQPQYNYMQEIDARMARLEQLQQQAYNQPPQHGQQPPANDIPTAQPQNNQPQVYSVESEQQARDYHVPENGLVLLLMKDGSKVFAKSHSTKDWKTDFQTFNKQEELVPTLASDPTSSPSNTDIVGMQTEIKEIKKLLEGVVENVQSIRETSAVLGNVERANERNTKGRSSRKSDSGGDAQSKEQG